MPMAVYVTVLAILFGFAVLASAEDRPSDPFGNHTIELNKDAPLVGGSYADFGGLRHVRRFT
jgi:hypothetical protein